MTSEELQPLFEHMDQEHNLILMNTDLFEIIDICKKIIEKDEQNKSEQKPRNMVHNLKTWPRYFNAIYSGEKKFEVRKNDRDFHKGDVLILEEWNPDMESYTGEQIHANVTYILMGGQFGIKEGFCVMGIDPFDLPEHAEYVPGMGHIHN